MAGSNPGASFTLGMLVAFAPASCASDARPGGGMEPLQPAGLTDCSAPDGGHAATLTEFVGTLMHAYSYTALTIDEMNALMDATRALDRRDLGQAAAAAASAGYRLAPLKTASACYWLLEPPLYPGAIEQAIVFYAADWKRDLAIEAPHAREDHNSGLEAATIFEEVGGKVLVVSGAHRCVQGVASSGCHVSAECSHRDPATGQTPAIPPAESDPSHSVHNALNAVHLALRTTSTTILQLHTNAHPEINGDALVSNGSRYVIEGTPADAFYAALRTPDADIRSCNDPTAPAPSDAFCGEINVQGLASNGAADQCRGRPLSTGGAAEHRFIHLEQSNYRMCQPADIGVNVQCLGTFDDWAHRVAAALTTSVPTGG